MSDYAVYFISPNVKQKDEKVSRNLSYMQAFDKAEELNFETFGKRGHYECLEVMQDWEDR